MAATSAAGKVAESASKWLHSGKDGGTNKMDDEKQNMTFPIPIRDDYVVEMKLPRNLKVREAEKLSRVLLALATDEAAKDKVTSISRL